MTRNYSDLCSVKIDSFELESPLGTKRIVNVPSLTLVKQTYALFNKERFISQTGKFAIGTHKKIGNKIFKHYKGVGKIQLTGTQGNFIFVEINNSFITVKRDYFAGFVGNLSIQNAKVQNHDVLSKTLNNVLDTLSVKSNATANAVSDKFIIVSGSGLVIIEIPFQTECLKKVEQMRNLDVSTVCTRNLIYFTPPYEFIMLEMQPDTCTLKGPCIFVVETGSHALAQEFKKLGGLLNG